MLFLFIYLVKYVACDKLVSIAITIVSLIVIKFLAPVEDINRPLDEAEITEFGKKLNITIICILFGSILFYLLEQERILFMIAVTTLFMAGILVIGKMNYMLKKKNK